VLKKECSTVFLAPFITFEGSQVTICYGCM